MSIMSWLRQVTALESDAVVMEQPLEFGKGEEMFRGLNMREVLDAHMAWIKRLESVLKKESQEQLDVDTISADCNCKLGEWLYGDAKREFGETRSYDELRQAHAEFHVKAGDVLSCSLRGDEVNAYKGLRELRRHSGMVQLSLVRLFAESR